MSKSTQEILFNNLILEWNTKLNLISRKRKDAHELIEDSKIFFNFIDFSKKPRILDLGTGGGFPGIPLRIHHPDVRLTLLDSIRKKIKAVTDIVQRLGLSDIEIICSRAEDLSHLPGYKNSFDYVIARAVATLDRLAKWSKDLLKPGGVLITIKGGDIEDEIIKTKNQKFVKRLEITQKDGKEIIEITFKT